MPLGKTLTFDFSFLFSHCLKTCFELCNLKYKTNHKVHENNLTHYNVNIIEKHVYNFGEIIR